MPATVQGLYHDSTALCHMHAFTCSSDSGSATALSLQVARLAGRQWPCMFCQHQLRSLAAQAAWLGFVTAGGWAAGLPVAVPALLAPPAEVESLLV